jgi:nucleoid-associated protein YgaU
LWVRPFYRLVSLMRVVKLFWFPLLVALTSGPDFVPSSAGAEPAELASLRAKAEKGNPIAQYNLGLAYAKSGDSPADLLQAFVWLSLASEGGPSSTELDQICKRLTEEQLTEGQRRLTQRRAALAAKPEKANSPSPLTAPEKIAADPAPESSIGTTPAVTPSPHVPPSGPSPASVQESSTRNSTAGAGSAQDEISNLRADRKQLSEELASAWKELDKNHADSQSAAGQIAGLKAQLNDTQKTLAAAQTRVNELSRPPVVESSASPEIAALKDQVQKSIRAVEELTVKNQNLTELAGERSRVANDSTTALAAARKTLADFATQKAQDNENLSRLTAENQALRQSNAAEKSGLEAELAEAKRAGPIAAQVLTLREQLRLTQAQATALADENFRLKTDRSLALSTPTRPNLSSPPTPAVSPSPTSIPREQASDLGAASGKIEPRTHVIVAGDTLTRISFLYYGTPNRWNEVLAANHDSVRDEHSLVIGRTLRIP